MSLSWATSRATDVHNVTTTLLDSYSVSGSLMKRGSVDNTGSRRLSESVRSNDWGNMNAWKNLAGPVSAPQITGKNSRGSSGLAEKQPHLSRNDLQETLPRSSLPPSSPPPESEFAGSSPVRAAQQKDSMKLPNYGDVQDPADPFGSRAAQRRIKERHILAQYIKSRQGTPTETSHRQQSHLSLGSDLNTAPVTPKGARADLVTRSRRNNRLRSPKRAKGQYGPITFYEALPAVGMDSVLSIPDLNSSPRVLSNQASGQHRYRTKHCNLPRKVKKKRKIRKMPAEKDLEREEIDLDQDEVIWHLLTSFLNKSTE